MSDLRLTFAIGDYLHMRELALGRVKPEGIDLTVLTLPLETIAYRFLATYEWEVSEFSLATYCAMVANGNCPMIGEMLQAQLSWIDASRISELVHKALDRKRVDEAADGAQRACAYRQTIENVMNHILVRKVVDWDGVALASRFASRQSIDAGRLRERRINVPRGQQRRALLQSRPRDVRIAPHLMAPIDDASRTVNRARHGHNHGGTVR